MERERTEIIADLYDRDLIELRPTGQSFTYESDGDGFILSSEVVRLLEDGSIYPIPTSENDFDDDGFDDEDETIIENFRQHCLCHLLVFRDYLKYDGDKRSVWEQCKHHFFVFCDYLNERLKNSTKGYGDKRFN